MCEILAVASGSACAIRLAKTCFSVSLGVWWGRGVGGGGSFDAVT